MELTEIDLLREHNQRTRVKVRCLERRVQASACCKPREAISAVRRPQLAQDSSPVSRTVIDIGMNNGDDSAHYLSKGYKVIAVEPNPMLVQRARTRFGAEIASGQMVIEPVGIHSHAGRFPFWINPTRDVFSSFDRTRAERGMHLCHSIPIDCITLDALLKKYGVPYYLKIDVEGAERYCLTSLSSSGLPQYVSVEAESLDYLLLLWNLGYRQFKIVDQMRHNSRFADFSNENVFSRSAKRLCGYADRLKNRIRNVTFPRGSSGPFGEDTSGDWKSIEEVAYNWLHLYFGYSHRGTLNPGSWFDFHAKAPQTSVAGDREAVRVLPTLSRGPALLG